MPSVNRNFVLRYGVAIFAVVSTLLLKLLFSRFMAMDDAPFLLGLGAVMVSAWYGGIGPGLLAVLLTVLVTAVFFLAPGAIVFGESLAGLFKLCVLGAEGVLVTLLGGMLHRSEARNAAIMQSAMDGIVTIDGQGRVVAFNPAAEQIFGLSASQVIGHELADLVIPPELRDKHRQGLRHFLATGRSSLQGRRLELPALRGDGSEITVEVSIVQLSPAAAPMFTGFVRDVSRRKQWEQARARLAAVVDSSSDAIIGRGPDGLICDWNSAAARLYGYAAEEMVGRSPAILLPPRQLQEEPELLDAIRTGRRLVQFETTRRHKQGRMLSISLTLSPVRDDCDRLIGWSSIERDITRRKLAERQQTAALTAAMEANRAKSEFLANVSHEVRTPLNAVIGMLDLALADEIGPALRDYLTTAHDSAKTLLVLLNDLLDFSRIEAGRFELELARFDVRHALAAAVRSLAIRARDKPLEVALDIAPDVPAQLVGDSRRLRQIIVNLVGNAIKFTERGEVIVYASLAGAETQPGEPAAANATDERSVLLKISVCDTGIGIAPEDQARIFEPFTQVDASSTRRHAGTGLGLAICRELSGRMGGRLWVESEQGRGSRFHFTARFSVPPGSAQDERILGEPLSGLRVLAVDDHSASRNILVESLSNLGAEPTSAPDAASALNLVSQAAAKGLPFHLIVVDHFMPGIDGPTLVERLRQEVLYSGQIVFMSAAAVPQHVSEKLLGHGVAAFLEKPASSHDLLLAVNRALGKDVESMAAATPEKTEHPLRVLLAEDTRANQKLVTTILERRGHQVTVAQNGREAATLAAKREFDVILMDVQMPVLDGFQATAAIRRLPDPKRAAVPVIALTAHAMHGDRERCQAAGMDDYLAKPIDTAQLMQVVERIAANGESREPRQNAMDSPGESPALSDLALHLAAALRRMGGNVALFRELAQFLEDDAPTLLEQLRSGLALGDCEQVAQAAQSLKGLAAHFHAEAVVASAGRLQEAAQSRQLATTSVNELVGVLQCEVLTLTHALEKYNTG